MPSDFPLWHHFTLTAVETPCYQCDRRTPGCHGSCEQYQAFSAERQEVYRQRMTYSTATRGRWRKELAKKTTLIVQDGSIRTFYPCYSVREESGTTARDHLRN